MVGLRASILAADHDRFIIYLPSNHETQAEGMCQNRVIIQKIF